MVSKRKINILLFTIINMILPVALVFSPYIFLALVVVCMVLIYKTLSKEDINWFYFIWLFSFFGISILGFKIYDIFTVILFIYLLIKKRIVWKSNLLIWILFLVSIVISSLLNYASLSSYIEVLRYIFSIGALIVYSSINKPSEKFSNYIILVVLLNIIQALTIYLMLSAGFKFDSNSFIGVDIFYIPGELRMNAFFSDPNKYFVFIFILAVMYLNTKKKTTSRRENYIFLFAVVIGTIISFSRTIFISYAMLIFLFLLMKIFKNEKMSIIVSGYLALAVILILVLQPNLAIDVINNMFVFFSKLIGRGEVIIISDSILTDPRIIIWKDVLEYIKIKPIFGFGSLSFNQYLNYPTHNTLLNLMFDYGLVGTFLYLFGVRKIFKKGQLVYVLSLIVVPFLMLDLANFRVFFVLLALMINKHNSFREIRIAEVDRSFMI